MSTLLNIDIVVAMGYLSKYLKSHPEGGDSAAISYLSTLDYLSSHSPKIAEAIIGELEDQRKSLKLIASENYSSLAVQLSMGNLLTDKYSEGYARHRFYAGCEHIDMIEEEASSQLKELFGCAHAYVQPHSGADANLIAFWAILVRCIQEPFLEACGKRTLDELSDEEFELLRGKLVSQKMLGMSLNSGGHLTHGYRHNVSAKMLKASTYDIDPETEELDYERIRAQAKREKPLILIAGYSSYPRKINFARMRSIADDCGATLLVDMAHFAGLVAGKVFTGEYNPIPYADLVTSTTHKTLRGPRGGIILCTEEYAPFVNKGCPLVMGGPLPHVMAAKAVAFAEANSPAFQKYARQVVDNAQALAEGLRSRGVTLFTGGTENHLLVADVSQSFGLTGRQAELTLRRSNITLNRNAVPFDPNGAWYTSGIRLGTPALTSRGMCEREMDTIADIIVRHLGACTPKIVEKSGKPSKAAVTIDEALRKELAEEVEALTASFPLYPELDLFTNG